MCCLCLSDNADEMICFGDVFTKAEINSALVSKMGHERVIKLDLRSPVSVYGWSFLEDHLSG